MGEVDDTNGKAGGALMAEDRQGFWELNGYHNDADPWTEQRHWF